MAAKSKVEWTLATWSPVTGCTKTSPGCKHCYVERFAQRLQKVGNPRYIDFFSPCCDVRPAVSRKGLISAAFVNLVTMGGEKVCLKQLNGSRTFRFERR